MASTINASTSSGIVQTADTSGVLQLQTANTTAVNINASQNVGVGLTTLTEKFEVNGSINASTASSNNFATGNARAFMDYVPGSNTARLGQLNGASGLTTGKVSIFNNGLESIAVDTTGRVTMPYNPAFMAAANSGSQTLTNSAYAQVTGLSITKYNIGNNYNTSTSTFTAPVAGLYAFKMYTTILTASANAITGGNDFQVKLFVNGTDYCVSGSNGDYGGQPVGYFAATSRVSYAYLNVGDTAQSYIFQNTGSSQTLQLAMCNFSGYLVR